jgi:hypothetical protein
LLIIYNKIIDFQLQGENMKLNVSNQDEILNIVEKGAVITENLLTPVYSFIPSFFISRLKDFSPLHIILACISRFSFGLFLGSTFPNFFKKHRIKILLIGIIATLPLIKHIFLEEK